jgi:futalosine hydrolase
VRLLIVTAVEAEREALIRGLPPQIDVVVGGVGPAAAAAATARWLTLAEAASRPYAAVLSAGIAGGFADRVPVAGTVVATRSVAAELGADSPEGFLPLDRLGFGSSIVECDAALLAGLHAALPGAVAGDVLTVCTVTGTAEGARRLQERWPGAVAESMEGFGVATAAAQAGIGYAELRTVSNPIGPRDRSAWRIGDALAALSAAAPGLASLAE